VTENLIASALPPLDSANLAFYAVLLWGLVKGGAKAYEAVTAYLERRKQGHAAEIDRATEGSRMSREEAVHLAEIQERTINRLEKELAEAEGRERVERDGRQAAEAEAGKLDAKLATAGRQWFEREGFIKDLERRLEALEKGDA
jgi:hypothetical protein